eukprot:SAG11_NODE_16788_length_537_cov_4.063927_1_plen_90_part_10
MDLAPDVGGTAVPATMAAEMRDLDPISPDFVYESDNKHHHHRHHQIKTSCTGDAHKFPRYQWVSKDWLAAMYILEVRRVDGNDKLSTTL